MPQIIIEQQFHYTAKMTSNKHYPSANYANHDVKLEKVFTGGRQSTLRSQNFHGGKIFR